MTINFQSWLAINCALIAKHPKSITQLQVLDKEVFGIKLSPKFVPRQILRKS